LPLLGKFYQRGDAVRDCKGDRFDGQRFGGGVEIIETIGKAWNVLKVSVGCDPSVWCGPQQGRDYSRRTVGVET